MVRARVFAVARPGFLYTYVYARARFARCSGLRGILKIGVLGFGLRLGLNPGLPSSTAA